MFYYWRARFQKSKKEESGFIKLQPQPVASGAIVLRLGNDLEVELPADYSPSALGELIQALRC